MRVSPFGHLRIKAYVRLPGAFRSLSRPSSAPSAKASALRSSSLDQSVSFDLFVLRFLAFYARTLLRSFPYVRRSFPAVMIFCYLNDNASIDVLRRSFLLLRLPILRVHKFPPFGFRSCSARLSYMRFSRCVGTCVSLPFRPSTVEHFFFCSGGHLLSHAVSSIVPSAAQIFTVVFGMGTGVASARIATRQNFQCKNHFLTFRSLLSL